MKTKILTSAVVLAAMLATSCDDTWTPPVGDDGQLDLSAINIVNDDAAKLIKTNRAVPQSTQILFGRDLQGRRRCTRNRGP